MLNGQLHHSKLQEVEEFRVSSTNALQYSSFFLTLRLRAPGDETEQLFGKWIKNIEISNTPGGKEE